MPLHKKKPFPLVEPPQDLDPGELVYQIRFTKEILRDYQEYLNRLNLYRQRVWTCKITGKSNLTYEEALVSEHRAAKKVQQFPKESMAMMLRMIQYSTQSLTGLVGTISSKLHEENLFEGLELHGIKDQSGYPCKILKVLEGNTTRYEVGWLDKDKKVTETSVVKAEDLVRKKPPYPWSVIKAFIRESTSQNAPWVIHEKLAKEHGILTEPPADLADRIKGSAKDNNDTTNRKRKNTENGSMVGMDGTKKKKGEEMRKEEPVKYPIDDLLVRSAADDPPFAHRPSLSTEFKVPMDCVGDLLMIWDFCSSFGRSLNLWRFSLEDFENAICHKESNLILIVESHAALLRLLIKDEGDYSIVMQKKKQRSSRITLVTWTEFLCDFLEMEGRSDFSKHLGTIKRGHYGLLNINIKLGIFRELVAEALTTNAIRERLDECIEQQQALALQKREEDRRKKEEQHLEDGMPDKQRIQNGKFPNDKENDCNDVNGTIALHEDVPKHGTLKANISKRNRVQENGERKNHIANSTEMVTDNENCSDRTENALAAKESTKGQRRKRHNDKDAQEQLPEKEQKNNLERELEKLYIRTNSLGKDRNYNRYWFFCREGRLFVESSDSNLWGYYTTKEELDALMASLNPKGERERALQKQLEKLYQRISMALQKRSKEIAQKALLEEGELRRSIRVRTQPREKPAFITYVNKWKDD